MKRKRSYIPYPEKLAATLACLLPQPERDDLRNRKASSSEVIALFHFDHIVLHAFDGADSWWNLDPKMVDSHREKSARDTSIVAKAKRIDDKWNAFMDALAKGSRPPRKQSRWPKRKFKPT